MVLSEALSIMFSDDVAMVQAFDRIVEQLMTRKQRAEEVLLGDGTGRDVESNCLLPLRLLNACLPPQQTSLWRQKPLSGFIIVQFKNNTVLQTTATTARCFGHEVS